MASHAHQHHEPEGPALAKAAQGVLEKAGEQWTAMRASVFAALAAFEKPASAYDIADAVSTALGTASRGEQRVPDPRFVRGDEPGA